jgi:DHA1 family multidrug resistance protein-like MFS transporter
VLVLDIIFLPETFAAVILTRKAARLRRSTKRWALHSKHEERERDLVKFLENNLTLPLRMIATEPMVTCITL